MSQSVTVSESNDGDGGISYDWNEEEYDKPWRDPDLLERLYVDEELTQREIADELECNHGTVSKWLNRYSIETDKGRYTRLDVSEDELEDMYIRRGMTQYQVADELECSHGTVSRWLDEYNIETDKGRYTRLDISESELKEMYVEKDMTTYEIADGVGYSQRTISNWLDMYGIETDEYRYFDGKEIYYGSNWDKQRQRAIDRDEGHCRCCGNGLSDVDFMDVHHITPLRLFKERGDTEEIDYDEANALDNLVTLCRSCHSQFEGRWTEHSVGGFVFLAQLEYEDLAEGGSENEIAV